MQGIPHAGRRPYDRRMKTETGIERGTDGVSRCFWCVGKADYEAYHDEEWGQPTADERYLFEKLCLEAFQCGLSWYTVLQRRPLLREAFQGFEVERVARYGERDIERLLAAPGMIKSRAKIAACIHNAGLLGPLVREFGSLGAFLWTFEPKPAQRPKDLDLQTLKALTESDASRALAKALRTRGWKFLGPVTAYAFLQSVGIVNDHLPGCAARERALAARKRFRPPV